jgi:serine/threonine protein kinase
MSISLSLLAFGVRAVFDGSAEELLRAVAERMTEHAPSLLGAARDRMTDHSQALPRALVRANDRAWQAVGLALAGDGLFERFKDVFRDGDLKGVRDQVKAFLDGTPTGLGAVGPAVRGKAAAEWHRLRAARRLSAESISPELVVRKAAGLARYASPAQAAFAAHRAVAETAAALRDDAPHLAGLLTTAPADGPPLLAAAFGFFFRREVETNPALARGLTFDSLRGLSEGQERGFAALEASLGAQFGPVLDRLDGLLDRLGEWFASVDARLAEIDGKLNQLIELRDVPTSASDPLKVTVTSRAELELLGRLRDALRALPPERVAAADWTKLGDALAAAGDFPQATQAHEAAAEAARAAADQAAEAEAHYKRFRDACETGDGETAMAAFRRAVELDPGRFTPFDLHRYRPQAVLGVGGFGTVFLAEDLYVGKGRTPQKVAVKAVHDGGADALLERDLSEAFDEADTLSALNHPGIVKTLNRGFGDPARQKRPYVVLEYFAGLTPDAWVKANGPLGAADVLQISWQIAEAVHAAHKKGVFHRDIKPGNVLVAFDADARRWQVKVIDFGLAVKITVARGSMAVPSGRRTALDRSLAGTLRYAPPEQRNELDADVGPYSDVYAWGKTCLDLLFGTTEPKSVHWKKLPAEYSGRVQALLERATLDDIEHPDEQHRRFAGFGPVLAELAGLLGEQPPPGPDAGGGQDASPVPPEKTPTPTVVTTGRRAPTVQAVRQPTPPAVETPAGRLRRIKAEAAARTEEARALLARYDYAGAVRVLTEFTPDQAEYRDGAMLHDATQMRDRLDELDRTIRKVIDGHRFRDPRLPVWLGQYLKLKPDDAEMRELLKELPPPNEPPASPKAGDLFTLRIVTPESEHQPGEIIRVRIPPVDRGPKPGTPTALTWKPVPARPNPNK